MRLRIRTIKPEIWADEKVGDLSHGARLLYVGLITMADDQGRLRELPAAILGHVFPYDNVSPAKLGRWLGEIAGSRMVVRYVLDGKRYLAFPHWTSHQRVDKPNPSELPSPPDQSPNGSPTNPRADRGSISDSVGDGSRSLRAGASGPIPSDPGVSTKNDGAKSKRAPSKRADQDALPEMAAELQDAARTVLPILQSLQAERGGDEPSLRGVGLAIRRFPNRDHETVARQLEHWALAGRGQGQPVKDWARTLATFLERSPAGSAVRTQNVVSINAEREERRQRGSAALDKLMGRTAEEGA